MEAKVLKRVYVTHCSKDKNPELELTGLKATPDVLYTSASLQAFIKYCNEHNHYWAILSDRYGVVFRYERVKWYNKPPDTVTEAEFEVLAKNFIDRLSECDEIYFHQRAGETHPFFQRIIDRAIDQGMIIKEFTREMMDRGE